MSHSFRLVCRLLPALFLTACAIPRPVPPPPRDLPRVLVPAAASATYTRCYQTEPDTYLLQTGSRTFKPRSGRGPTIELLGAAHIGETSYYASLQQRMDRADAVLYELVTDERKPAKTPTAEESARLLAGSAYYKLANLLDLAPQKQCLRYDRKHYVRCDMTLQQMRGLLEAEIAAGGRQAVAARRALSQFATLSNVLRGRSWLVNFGFWAADKSDWIKARLKLKLVVNTPGAREDQMLDSRLVKLINADRNAHVLRELPKFIAAHPAVNHLVIFYGSAHLPGLAQGLAERGYVPAGPIEWFTVARSHPLADGLDPGTIQHAITQARQQE
jgi:hypothetical protein